MSATSLTDGDVHVTIHDDHVAVAEIRRPPNNFFDLDLIESLAATFVELDDDAQCRAIVLCSQGKHFCAGADFAGRDGGDVSTEPARHLYDAAYDLFATKTPVVAAIQGAAVGGGLGLACMPDFRVAAPEARFSANFARLGFHHGFGLTVTLPALAGGQRALEMLYTGRRIDGQEALEIGLVDRLVPLDDVRDAAARPGARDRRVGTAGGAIDPRDDARRPRRPHPGGDRSGAGRAGPAPPDGGLDRGRAGDGRAPPTRVHRGLRPTGAPGGWGT